MSDDADLGVTSGPARAWAEWGRRLVPSNALTVERLRDEHEALVARVAQLEKELGQERRMQRRVAELVDIVQQLLVEQASTDEGARARLEAFAREV